MLWAQSLPWGWAAPAAGSVPSLRAGVWRLRLEVCGRSLPRGFVEHKRRCRVLCLSFPGDAPERGRQLRAGTGGTGDPHGDGCSRCRRARRSRAGLEQGAVGLRDAFPALRCLRLHGDVSGRPRQLSSVPNT